MGNSDKRLFLTGASGLLGRMVFKKFCENGWEVMGVAYSRATPPLVKLDINDAAEVQKALASFSPTFVIHCAALRFPDQVESHPEDAIRMNVKTTEQLASISDKVGVPLLYISTDYVFDGKNPPYKPGDPTNPTNLYGKTKLDGEIETLKISEENLVLRIPVLYGSVEKLSESAVTVLLESLLNTSKQCNMSNYERRYPSSTEDIAEICLALAEKKLAGSPISGIFQWSGKEALTKYEMVLKMAKVFGLPHEHVKPVDGPGSGGAPRPYDTQLDSTSLVEALGTSPKHTPFEEGIKASLSAFQSIRGKI
ncbi:methionine adenosyltransferase 2 subunit beta-like [Ischnura elegans]|uniref:methionine adenosyltransferase 2 subunit beta-like n=1 Tax=Ischnura elegans TaxID=197161 RepID=UPI001ED8B354|nr:methionine adenosyltransferase 2 subunit beta-like [Ischnura elegans]